MRLSQALSKTCPSFSAFSIADTVQERPSPGSATGVQPALRSTRTVVPRRRGNLLPVLHGSAPSAAAASFLVGDEDARIRRVQAFAVLGDDAYPTLCDRSDAADDGCGERRSSAASPAWLRLDRQMITLDDTGSLRFVASTHWHDRRPDDFGGRRSCQGKLCQDSVSRARLVFIGSSLPNLGGLQAKRLDAARALGADPCRHRQCDLPPASFRSATRGLPLHRGRWLSLARASPIAYGRDPPAADDIGRARHLRGLPSSIAATAAIYRIQRLARRCRQHFGRACLPCWQ